MKDSDRVVLLYDRLKDELGYTSALPWSIFAASPRRAGASLLACGIGALNQRDGVGGRERFPGATKSSLNRPAVFAELPDARQFLNAL
jgi:hypothetical protein